MLDRMNLGISWLQGYPLAYSAAMGIGLILCAIVCSLILRLFFIKGLYGLFRKSAVVQTFQQLPTQVISQLLNVIPAMIIMYGVPHIPGLPKSFIAIAQNACSALIVLTLGLAVTGILDMINTAYQSRSRATQRSIKAYIQITKIVVYCAIGILFIAALIDRSPVILFSGLGAIAAVSMFVFQSTISSFVANLTITSTGIIRLGDWIEVPEYNANGDVVDIALTYILVKNHDSTLVTIPTKFIVEGSLKNYRLVRAGSRRIKRPVFIDQNTVKFLTETESARLSRFLLINHYLDSKTTEISTWNAGLPVEHRVDVNTRRLTNLGTFRVYLEEYLKTNPMIDQSLTLMVRQLDPTPNGLPLEIYCWSKTSVWVEYERIASDILDHVIAILPEFGLSVHQQPSGVDVRALTFKLAP